MSERQSKPIWREPVVWIVIGLPLATLIAGAVTIGIALKQPADSRSADVSRIAQIQFEDQAADHLAAEHGLRATLNFNAASGTIELFVEPEEFADDALMLQLEHPVQAAKDRELPLRREGRHWVASTAPWGAQAWRVHLTGDAGRWRLSGRLDQGASATQLLPAVSR